MNVVRQTGSWEKTAFSGETVAAFVPAPLPPTPPVQVEPALLIRARIAMSKLEQARLMVPSIDWFIYSFARKEAVMSSQIEGTQATLVDLFAAEASPSESPDLEEVFNYISALEYARTRLHDPRGLPLSMRLLDGTHAQLMKGVRGSRSAPGQIRRTQNWIGGSRPGNAVYVPPPPQHLPDILSAFERYMHADDVVDPLVRIGLLHVQFETIHPYLDGNGRLGRLLITLLLEHWHILTEPLLYPSLFLKHNRDEYYRRLTAVRTHGDWEGWTDFFLRVIADAAETASTAIVQLFTIVDEDRTRITEAAKATSTIRLFARLPRNPFVSIARAASLLATSRTTASRAIDELVALGVLEPDVARYRDRTFHYARYVEYLRQGTDLEPVETRA